MKKKIILFLGTIILSFALFSGCNQQATITSDEPNYVVSNTSESIDNERKIEHVCVEIQNFDNKDMLLTIDFQFTLLDLDELGQNPYGGGRNNGGGTAWDDFYTIQKTVIIQAHDIEKIYCTPQSQYDNKIEVEWDYEISASFV